MDLTYLPFEASEVPGSKEFQIDGVTYTLLIEYNDAGGFYTLAVLRDDSIVYTTRLNYAVDALADGRVRTGIARLLIPLDFREFASTTQVRREGITTENFGTSDVRLLLV